MAFSPASGILGQIKPAANTEIVLYTCPADARASVSITACNTGAGATTATIKGRSGSTNMTLASAVPLAPSGQQGHTFEQRAVILGPGQSIVVSNFSGNVEFTAMGYTAPANVLAF